MKTNFIWLFLFFVSSGTAFSATGKTDACEYFFQALKAVPHKELSRSEGEHKSLWDEKKHSGCEVKFVTDNGRLSGREAPAFPATEGTELYSLGWRMNNSLVADGPGEGIFGIERGSVLCLVSHSQPAYMDEKTNKIVQSETLKIVIQCRQK